MLLILLTLIEELVVGKVHGKSLTEIASELAERSLLETAAISLLMVLVLTPYFAMREINSELGDGVILRLLMTPRKALQASKTNDPK